MRGMIVLVALTAACGGGGGRDAGLDGSSPDAGDAGMDASLPDVGMPDAGAPADVGTPPPGSRIPEAEAAAGRAACGFERGAMPWETIGEEYPLGAEIPFDRIIMVMLENRSFDHYFGTMPGVDGIPAGASNPRGDGTDVAAFHTDEYCIEDVTHSWNGSHRQYNGGLNDGFVTTNNPGGERAMGYLDETDLPFYRDLYGRFAMSDHHFCSVLGPTWVNRFYYMSGTSFGRIHNDPPPDERLTEEPWIVFQQLDAAGIDWRVYQSDVPFVLGGYPRYSGRHLRQIKPLDQFYAALSDGSLPEVTYVDPSFFQGVDQTDEHPPADPQFGQAFIRELVQAVFASPLWPRIALVVTYDEHGGFYDHVPPPEACPPGDHPPDLAPGDQPGDYDRLGFRVPLVVVSPYARAGYVSDRVTDLTSVLRLVQARFLLPALTGRDANAWPLLDMFDFESPPFMTPPDLAEAPVDEAVADACRMRFPGGFDSL